VSAAIVRYYASDAWTKDLAESSRAGRRRILEKFRGKHGDNTLGHIEPKHMQAIIKNNGDKDAQSFTPVVQGNWLRAMRGFTAFAVKEGLIANDRLRALRRTRYERARGTSPGPRRTWRPIASGGRSAPGNGSRSRS
jgi:hypothetical protein